MKSASWISALALAVIAISGCGDDSPAGSPAESQIHEGPSREEQRRRVIEACDWQTVDVSYSGTIRFATTVPDYQRDLILADLTALEKGLLPIGADPTTREMLKLALGIKSADSETLLQWLEERISYIVPEDFEDAQSSTPYQFPNPGVFPEDIVQFLKPYMPGGKLHPKKKMGVLAAPVKAPPPPDVFHEGQGVTMASNEGAWYYLVGKAAGYLWQMNIPGHGNVPATSPRAGVMKIGEGLFMDGLGVVEGKPCSRASSILRLGTLFHEARHSDGNSESAGFAHAPCPAGKPLQGKLACDRNTNGPYMVGGMVTEALGSGCDECDASERSVLEEEAARQIKRWIEKFEKPWDTTPEGDF